VVYKLAADRWLKNRGRVNARKGERLGVDAQEVVRGKDFSNRGLVGRRKERDGGSLPLMTQEWKGRRGTERRNAQGGHRDEGGLRVVGIHDD